MVGHSLAQHLGSSCLDAGGPFIEGLLNIGIRRRWRGWDETGDEPTLWSAGGWQATDSVSEVSGGPVTVKCALGAGDDGQGGADIYASCCSCGQ